MSDGSKCDIANIQEIFAADTRIAIPDPVYPVYVDTNVMAGRTGPNANGRYSGLVYLDSTAANGYVPSPPAVDAANPPADLIYLCFPNNPTGAAGAGFGKCGEGHMRISAFNSRANVETAPARIAAALK